MTATELTHPPPGHTLDVSDAGEWNLTVSLWPPPSNEDGGFDGTLLVQVETGRGETAGASLVVLNVDQAEALSAGLSRALDDGRRLRSGPPR